MSKKYFKEKVEIKGKVYWIGGIVLIFLLSMLGFLDKMKESDSLSSLSGASIAALAVGMIIFVITKVELKTKVTSKSIDVKLSPFYRSKVKIPHSDVASYRIVETEPFTVRTTKNFNSWFEKRFTLTGRNGVSITTCNGRNYFIGTTDPAALKKALQKAYGSK
ncbi:hypothetical protein O3Q51_01570 [Cryomorphaceae bacterium 1068]|nr:hypothetical protein [Cryomorphaceae bacterium 1068]